MAGMKPETAIVITRRQFGQWASYIAGVTLLLGILGLLWQTGFTPIIIGLIAIGIISILLWAMIAPRDFRDFVTGRQVRYGTMAVFSSLLIIGIVVTAYILLQRAALTLDMTEGRRFSLSDETLEVLARIDRDIRITGFYDTTAIQLRETDDQFFRLYETATEGRITRRYIDPNEEPALAQRFNAFRNGDVFLSFLDEAGEVDFSSLAPVPRQPDGAQEREMTTAILRLLNTSSIKVYFEVGLSELDPQDTSQQGLSGIHLGMQQNGLITDALNLSALAAARRPIPDDANAVIMARPTSVLRPEEIAVLDDYLQRGGGLLILADALFNEDAFLSGDTAFNRYLWDNFGISALDAVIVDYAANVNTPLDVIGFQVYSNNAIGARLNPAEAPTLFRISRALNINDEPPVNNGRIVVSSPDSYGETNFRALAETNTYEPDPAVDPPGPLSSVVWAWNEETDARILLVGDSDFVTNGFVGAALGNAVLFTDGLAWLTGLSEQVNFSPQAFFTAPPLIMISTQTLDAIAALTVFIMPGLVLVTGLAVWLRRIRQ